MTLPPAILGLFLSLGASLTTACANANPPLQRIELPPGFHIGIFAEVPAARSLTLGADGTVFVGTRKDDTVHALQDRDGDGRADAHFIVAKGLDTPNGVAFHDGDLYVAEVGRLLRFADIEARLGEAPLAYEVIRDGLPTRRHHGWRYIAFGPDDRLYISIGAPCNVCDEPGFGVIDRMDADGGHREVFALGVRNSVGMDWNPATGVLWFTDNGRDLLGDDLPPDELNRAPRPGMHFGFPYCHGGTIADPQFGRLRRCEEFEPPAMPLGPHVASLGMRFYTGRQFPADYRGQIFIAEHGSWNRSVPIGYRVSLVTVKNGKALDYRPFATGWLRPNGKAWGRPVDLLVMPDGALLLSDDKQGVIYRIWYEAAATEARTTPETAAARSPRPPGSE